MKKLLKWISALLVIGIVGFVIYFLNDALPIGTGYSAKYVCSQVFLADRDPGFVFKNDVQPSHLLFRIVKPIVDYKNKSVTSKAFGFWKPMTAIYREGCGCTLLVDTTRDALLNQTQNLKPADLKRSDAPWPQGKTVALKNLPESLDKKKLTNAIDIAFKEPGPETHKNTQAVIVVLGDKIIAEKYAPGFNWDTPILGWSMSKSVTNTLVGILVKDKVLDIHKPAPVAAWQSQDDPRNKITLDMLLRMSSGLSFEETYAPFKDATDMLYASKSMPQFAANKNLSSPIDTQWYYSSGTANIIARIITNNVGGDLVSYYNFSKERLFNKIMAYSALIEPDPSGVFVGSSYMFATARDWARFGLFLKNDGIWNGERILPEGWVAYSVKPTPAAPQGKYGAHFWLNAGEKENPDNRRFPSLPRDLYFCQGFNSQIVAVIPSKDLVIVRLGATHDNSWNHEIFIKNIIESIQ